MPEEDVQYKKKHTKSLQSDKHGNPLLPQDIVKKKHTLLAKDVIAIVRQMSNEAYGVHYSHHLAAQSHPSSPALAAGQRVKCPFGLLAESSADYIKPACLPQGFALGPPDKLPRAHVRKILDHWIHRQSVLKQPPLVFTSCPVGDKQPPVKVTMVHC
jgi:hypothetical protein